MVFDRSLPTGRGAPETRRALLLAGGEVFAEVGFRTATVREICRRAGTNGAAVNYHFGDKERLYLEVFRFAAGFAAEKYPDTFAVTAGGRPEAKLKAFVLDLLRRILDGGPCAWHGKLMAMEMIDPTRALDTVVEERIRPMAERLAVIVTEFLGPGAPPDVVRRCGSTIVSQCVFHRHCQAVLRRLWPQQEYGLADIERLADHITEFSVAGLRQFARTARRPS